jgi:hypothetical protein
LITVLKARRPQIAGLRLGGELAAVRDGALIATPPP